MSAPSQALRLGTRTSPLATVQSSWVADRLRGLGYDVELVPISTLGDQSRDHLTTIGGTGVFAAAIRRALLDGEVDLAVHSLKDLPVTPEPGLVVAAVPAREDPRDVLVARDGLTLGELPSGSVVATGAPRRQAQLAALGLGLSFEPVRGNVDTRIGMVAAGRYDAVVLARAGLARLGRLAEATEVLDPIQVLPAAGQGALAIECSSDRPDLVAALAVLDDHDTRLCVTAERSLLRALEAGCTAPIGVLGEVSEVAEAYADPSDDAGSAGGIELSLRAFLGTTDGASTLRRSLSVTLGGHLAEDDPAKVATRALVDAASAGDRLAALLLEDGAADLGARTSAHLRPPAEPPDGVPKVPKVSQPGPLAAHPRSPGSTPTSLQASHMTEQVS